MIFGINNGHARLYESMDSTQTYCNVYNSGEYAHTLGSYMGHFLLTIHNNDLNGDLIEFEIVKVTSITKSVDYDTFTIVRGQENTAKINHEYDKMCSNFITAKMFEEVNYAVGDINGFTEENYVINGISNADNINNLDVKTKNLHTTLANTNSIQVQIQNILNALKNTVKEITLNVKDFGAVGDGVIDDTVAIQETVNYSIANGNIPIYFPSGTYLITETIAINQGYTQFNMKGSSTKNCTISYPSLVNKPAFKITGGSGALTGGEIKNFKLDGNGTSIGLEFAGVCGFEYSNISFENNGIGVLLHNELINTWTEFVVGRNCVFSQFCKTSVRYKKTNGNESFHGSGLITCIIGQDGLETQNKIIIDNGCIPYNAPLDIKVFISCATSIIKGYGTTDRIPTFHGNITTEVFGSGFTCNMVDKNNPKPIGFVGNFSAFSTGSKLGKLILLERYQYNPDGSMHMVRKDRAIQVNCKGGYSNLFTIEDGNTSIIANVLISGANYEYSYLITAYHNPGDSNGKVTILATQREFNSAGYNAPQFSFADNQVRIYNANYPATGITALCGIKYIANTIINYSIAEIV